MLKNLGIKNIITLVFVVGAVLAFLVFSGAIKFGADKKVARGKVVVWGTIPYSVMQTYVDKSKTKNLSIIYKTKDPKTFEEDLINAFASGTGPDLFIMSHENILRHADKVFAIPYESYPQHKYEATYINEAKIFLSQKGILAVPLSVDPLVMYYNKQLVSSAFLVEIPKYWDEFTDFVSKITVSDSNGAIRISGVSLGTYDNILNAKGILSTLFIQNGNKIVNTDPITIKKRSELSFTKDSFDRASQAINFYTSFSQFGNSNYSWNEAVIPSREKFIAGELAIYFGKASEVERIRKKNPNLDFDVSLMPQINETSIKSTYGSMLGIAISKQSKNIGAAISVASKFAGNLIAKDLTSDLLVAPARKDLLKEKPDDAFTTLLYNSAIISSAWVDPSPEETDLLFKQLIRSINTGSLTLSDALRRANADLDAILNRTINTTIEDRSLKDVQ
jgi:ABC-type glycerol-3-phosphate transport system substrate-binding protein